MAPIPNDVFFATIPELNARLNAKEFKAEDLARAFAERLAQLGPRYNALALSLEQEACRKGKAVDQELKTRAPARAACRASPTAPRICSAYAGQPTTWGAKPYAGQVFDYNATVIDKLDTRGRRAHRQTRHGGTGGRRRISLRLGLADRAGAESLGPHALVRRFVERLGGRRGRGPGDVRHRLGNFRLDRHARLVSAASPACAPLTDW